MPVRSYGRIAWLIVETWGARVSEKQRIKVKLLKPKDGLARAQLYVGSTAVGKARSLAEFSDAVQEKLKDAGPDVEVFCAPMADPDPKRLQPTDPPTPRVAGARSESPERRVDPAQRQPEDGGQAPGHPGFDRNPYNFAEWEGDQPWTADASEKETHERWRYDEKRYAGVMTVRVKAATPVFVPEGRLTADNGQPDREPQHFWRCHDHAGVPRFGIPGSSVKGVIRTLYETLTNSRLGVLSEQIYEKPIPYRRRSATGWVIASKNPDGSIDVLRCALEFVFTDGGGLKKRQQAVPNRIGVLWAPPGRVVRPPNSTIDPSNTADWQAIRYRANLLWTDSHTHDWKELYVRVGTARATIAANDVTRYTDNLNHPMYEANPDHAASATKNFYANNASVKRQIGPLRKDLRRLEIGDLVFGIPDPARPGYLACFGKNVNFLWPSRTKPEALLKEFRPRGPKEMSLTQADYADLGFGFAGADEGESHPFRGKIRFSTFWAVGEPKEMPELRLGPLTSPSGTKLKARSLYLPGKNGIAQTYDEAARLRGRKFYWHQRSQGDGADPKHTAQPGQAETQLPPPIHPLPAGTEFKGHIAFDNLSDVELGALIAAVCPSRLFNDKQRYGWKIGKAKPRGLGSVEPTACFIDFRPEPRRMYTTLKLPITTPIDVLNGHSPGGTTTVATGAPAPPDSTISLTDALDAYRQWVTRSASKPWADVGFIQDLRKILRLPDSPQYFGYLDNPNLYGWMPEFYDPARPPTYAASSAGDPRGGAAGRRPAMKRARDS